MMKFGPVESTLFVPMLGRIYASEQFPHILYDEQALSLKSRLPKHVIDNDGQSQYTYIASACRSANMDRYIGNFLKQNPQGAIVQLGCGLETAFQRNDNNTARWYAVDLPHVINYRRSLLPEPDRECYIEADAFADVWVKRIRRDVGDAPVLVTAGGLFHYFEEEKVIGLLRMLLKYGGMEVVFDAVSRFGLYLMRRKWMKEIGHEEAHMHFYVDSAARLSSTIGVGARVMEEVPYYSRIDTKGLIKVTRLTMYMSDRMHMVKMIHLKL